MVRFKVTGDYTCMGDQPLCHMVIYWFDSLHLSDWILCEMYPQNARDMSSWHQSMHGHWHAGTGHIFEHVVGFLSPLNWWSFLSYDKRHAGGFWAVILYTSWLFYRAGSCSQAWGLMFPPMRWDCIARDTSTCGFLSWLYLTQVWSPSVPRGRVQGYCSGMSVTWYCQPKLGWVHMLMVSDPAVFCFGCTVKPVVVPPCSCVFYLWWEWT